MVSSPDSENTSSTVKSGSTFSLSGKLGFNATGSVGEKGPSGSITGSGDVTTGISFTHDETVTIKDCTVANNSGGNKGADSTSWTYNFRQPGQHWVYTAPICFSCRLNSEPPELSRTTFQPKNKWVWRFSPNVREGKNGFDGKQYNFVSKLDVNKYITVTGFCFLGDNGNYGPWTNTYNSQPFVYYPSLYYPPVIVAPAKNYNFNASAQSKPLEVTVARDWSAQSDQAWCQSVPTTGKADNPQLSLTVDKNDTGKERKAIITFKTWDYKGDGSAEDNGKIAKMVVTQAQY